MAVQKKKRTLKQVRNSPGFVWTPQRKQAAVLIAEGTKNYKDIAFEVGIEDRTLRRWRQSPIFLEEVSRLTLANEKATREGLLRIAYNAIETKMGKLEEDKSTLLDWTKFISDLQGMTKQKIEFDNVTSQSIPRTPAVIDAEYELLKAISKAESKDTKQDE
jgi:transposase-like protein